MVKEKDKATIVQVYASGIAHRSCLLGKSLAYLLVGVECGCGGDWGWAV